MKFIFQLPLPHLQNGKKKTLIFQFLKTFKFDLFIHKNKFKWRRVVLKTRKSNNEDYTYYSNK